MRDLHLRWPFLVLAILLSRALADDPPRGRDIRDSLPEARQAESPEHLLVTGEVVDEEGRPIARAEVDFQARGQEITVRADEHGRIAVRLPIPRSSEGSLRGRSSDGKLRGLAEYRDPESGRTDPFRMVLKPLRP
jgi:hypothetical protein